MEDFKRLKGEHVDILTTRIIRDRAKGRCEFEWWDHGTKLRCGEHEGEKANHFKGFVKLQLMPVNGLLDHRIASQKVYCQKHAYNLLAEITKSHAVKGTRTKPNKDQTSLFAQGL